MTRDRTVLILGVATVVAAAVLTLVSQQLVWLRALVGIPFVLLLPGSATMLLVDPEARLGVSEWVTLCIGLSISIAILVGMGLALTLGLSAEGLTWALTVSILAALVVAAMKSPPGSERRVLLKRRSPIRRIGAGAITLLACVAIGLIFALPDPFTAHNGDVVQLWGLPTTTGGVSISAHNINAEPSRYYLTIQQNGRTISEQDVKLPEGTTHVFEVKPSALVTTAAPVAVRLVDKSGEIAARTISVWTTK